MHLQNKYKFLFIGLLGIALVVIISIMSKSNFFASTINNHSYTILEKGSSINKINVKGTVESEDTIDVYSNNNFIVKNINVKFGDEVKKGDILATLDTSDLEKEIETDELKLQSAKETNSSNLEAAKKKYEIALSQTDETTNSDLINAKTNAENSKLDLNDKEDTYERNKVLYNQGAITKNELDKSNLAVEVAQNLYNNAVASLNNIKSSLDLSLSAAQNDYEKAQSAYNNKSDELALQHKKDKLKDSTIYSPANGIVSNISAVTGAPNTGTLFKIQTLDNLYVTLKVKEFDINKIQLGQKAQINSDSLEGSSIEGTVVKINKINTNDSNSLALNDDSNDKESEYEVKIQSPDISNLQIGMNVNADIIIDETDDVYTVPSECIIKDSDDNSLIYIAEEQSDHSYIVKSLNVSEGTKSDINSEIISDSLKDGLIILNNPLDYTINDVIKIKD